MRICIDPGHGGYDPGAVGPSGVLEKDVTLAVSLLLADLLRQAGIEVTLTRDSDATSWDEAGDLGTRCSISDQFGADIFISIHANAAANPAGQGMEVYTTPGYTDADALAESVINSMEAAFPGMVFRADPIDGDQDKEANYYVLKRTSAPAILVELAFISNPDEEALLNSLAYQQQAALAIAQGVGNLYGFSVGQAAPDPNAITIKAGDQACAGTLINGTAFAPVRKLAELLGRTVWWNGETRTVIIE